MDLAEVECRKMGIHQGNEDWNFLLCWEKSLSPKNLFQCIPKCEIQELQGGNIMDILG